MFSTDVLIPLLRTVLLLFSEGGGTLEETDDKPLVAQQFLQAPRAFCAPD